MNHTTTGINFMRLIPLYFTISGIFLAASIISLVIFGLRPAIDFTGGTLIELQEPPNVRFTPELVQTSLPQDVTISSFQRTEQNSVVIRTKPISAQENEAFKYNLASQSGLLDFQEATVSAITEIPINELRFETVGPTLGRELVTKTIFSIILASGAIMAYLTFRFNEFRFGAAAIFAMFHDTLIVIGTFSLLGRYLGVEIDSLFVTAVLTSLAFSVHDTIVVFDRMRENQRNFPKLSITDISNKSVTETLSRSINNSMTTIFMLLALYLLGGETIKWFVFALLTGIITGTYSSPFFAVPILVIWDRIYRKRSGSR